MFKIVRTAVLAAVVACPSYADQTRNTLPQGQIGESGYSQVKGNYWWNATERHCLSVSLQDGAVQSVSNVRPAVCGLAVRQVSRLGAGCPLGTLAQDYDSFPDCREIMAGR